ncbi:uncharacterized protein M421DRAFT_98486 [Didymella exigua CBS 183.55]|uniref:CoA-dependent acyltransferase n=1 Tax=Didymella exigua CBS 183.55 TaxID=1150837 RepID=A0A6A5S1I0_9PLEO|nr:uncharacterized protein M421DRAFT_98486 [Didymella exigua CBS 183.55]KAF1932346.1 hypothetical protein M421DRAFT_98486 [Didymella exigua CBS 183.55]
MASPQKENAHWLDRYATGFHAWRSTTNEHGQTSFTRPLGLVETSFDSDGAYYGGRADMTGTLTLELHHSLCKEDLRRRIALAWTALRLRHVLLMSRHLDDPSSGLRCFAIDVPRDVQTAVRDVEASTVWIEDSYASVDAHHLHDHALNVRRIVEPRKCMSKLHVLPLVQLATGTHQLSFLIVMAHQISDGLSAYGWFKDLIRLLNQPVLAIEAEISASLARDAVAAILPPAQEDLYPRIAGNRARQRWVWAIIRVVRHVKRTLPPTLANPLYRAQRRASPLPLERTYDRVFAYDGPNAAPLSSGHVSATLSAAASARLIALCRDAQLSIGAGCFALAGLAMMHVHAQRYPGLGAEQGAAISASFPLNPRAFFASPPPAESCMLSFSDGIVMPFLPLSLAVEKRFLLTARIANRGLRVYQKRLRTSRRGEVSAGLDSHSPARLLAAGYLAQMERVASKLPAERPFGFGDPQGALTAAAGADATCGVSSVGSLKGYFRAGEYDLNAGKDFAVDYRGLRMGVRAREREFLVGSSTDAEGRVGFGVSYDANAIEPEAAETWARTIAGLLEPKAKL